MKTILSLILSAILLAATVPGIASAQQTPSDTKCNDESALTWVMNTESDMDHYTVYSSNSPITVIDPTQILLTVPHPGTGTDVTHPLNSTLSDGPKYFRVTASDAVGNESPLSNEAGCMYDKIPSEPGQVQILLKAAPQVP
jgi:hypothetical protein